MRTRRLALALRIGGVVLVAVLLWLFGNRINWSVLGNAFRRASLWPLLLASSLYLTSLLGKALVWRILLAPRNVIGVGRLYRYTIAAFAASVFAPARAGELLRVLALKQRDGVPAADAMGVAIADKLLHAISLLLLAAPLPLLLPSLPDWVEDSLLVCASIAAGILIAVHVAVGRVEAREPQSWFGRFLVGMQAIRDPRRMLAALGALALVWCADLASLMSVLHAVGVDLPLAGGLFILFSINLAIAIPTTPASVGTMQLGALVATGLLGVPREPALAFALLYQAMQIAPVLILGFALEMHLVVGRAESGKLAA